VRRALAALVLVLAAGGCSGPAEDPRLQPLLDRTAIADMMDDLYRNVETASTTDYDRYFTPDTVFEINGTAYRGHDAIQGYQREVAESSPMLKGTFHMLLNNLRVAVEGDTATAQLYFTGVLSETLMGDPRLLKHGREYDLLQRQSDGGWRITKRVIVSDASATSDFAGVERPGEGYDILKAR
jgi:ketosteroid isomerase-like protein